VREQRGLPRLRALFDRWVKRVSVELDSGCIYISGAVEFDDRPGPVRDALASMVRDWQSALERAIRLSIEAGHLRADTDTLQMLFEVHGLILALHHDARFLRLPGAVDRARARVSNASCSFYLQAEPAAPAAKRTRPTLNLFDGFSDGPAGTAFQRLAPRSTPCPSTTRRFATCSSAARGARRRAHAALLPPHADIDADTLNAVLEEGGKFAAEVGADQPQRRCRGLHARQGHP
jgi:hypothetical protein